MAMHNNPFVDYLNRYTTVSPEHEAAFDEFISQKQTLPYANEPLKLETKTEYFVREQFQIEQPPSIILTGNAGDGKTYLCRQIIEEFTGEAVEEWPPEVIWTINHDGLNLQVVKDLSEVGEDTGAEVLSNLNLLLSNDVKNSAFLIAANEGRLRAILSRKGLERLHEEVDRQLRAGPEIDNPHLIVLNLNQVTTSTYVTKTLGWLSRSEHWTLCNGCPAIDACPIRFNALRLSDEQISPQLKFLYQILEHLGIHLTIRDMLVHLTFTITGGLDCETVIRKQDDPDWRDHRHLYVYYENIWGETADEVFQRKISATRHLRRLDVGKSSVFDVDNFIINEGVEEEFLDEHQELFSEGLDLGGRLFLQRRNEYLKGGASAQKPEQDHPLINWLPHCRRKVFFEWNRRGQTDRLLPFLYLVEYFRLLSDDAAFRKRRSRDIVLGLNRAFSGLFLSNDNNTNLYVTSQYAHAVEQPVPIVRVQIPSDHIELQIQDQYSEALDRDMVQLVLDVPPPPRVDFGPHSKIWSLDLLMYEYLMRRAKGGTPDVLAEECELEIRRLKDEILTDFVHVDGNPDHVTFFAAEKNKYVLKELWVQDGKIQAS